MDEREKIISIIRPIIKDRFLLYCHEAKDCINCDTDCQVNLAAKDFADALIAANIGDITEWKERAECAKRILQIPTLPNGTTDLSYFEYKGERIQDIARQRDEYKHRAEVAERALATVCEEVLHARYPVESVTVSVVEAFIQHTLKEAEKELAEEKGSWKPTGVAKLKLSLASEVIVKSENANAECKAKPIDELTCRATLSDNELKDTSRVLYLVSRLYQNLISEVAGKGMCGEEDKTE